MRFTRLLPYACLFAAAANAQDTTSSSSSSTSTSSSSSSSSSGDETILTGTSELATPTGSYLSITTTVTRTTALTTSALISTVTSASTTRTTTYGSTTIYDTNTMVGNTTANATTVSTSSDSRTLLVGATHTTMPTNGTNSTMSSNSTATSTSTSVQPTNTTPCNNYPEFCERSYGNVTEISAHNSPFVKAGSAAANQDLDVTIQLNDGIRLLQGQMHFVNTTGTRIPHFCHTSCDLLDAGPITEYLGKVFDWVSSHPYDVVTILLGNGDYDPVEDYVPFIEQTGLVQYAYEPPKIPMALSDWPTYASMILSGKRVVIFMDYDANQTSTPWILDEFSQMWETPFDPTDATFPCTVERPPDLSDADAKNRLYMINHDLNYDIVLLGNSVLVPNIPLLNVTNNVTGDGSLGKSTGNCIKMWDHPPKFLNVDFYNRGGDYNNGTVFEVQAQYNNVTYNRECCGATSTTSDAERTRELMGRSAMLMAAIVVLFHWALL